MCRVRWCSLIVTMLVVAFVSACSKKDTSHVFPIVDGGRFGYINASGTTVVAPQFDYAGEFREGLAPVQVGYHLGFINESGTIAINPSFEPVFPLQVLSQTYHFGASERSFISGSLGFSEGLAPVIVNGKWEYIDTKGRTVIAPRFELAGRFSEGLALVMEKGQWSFVNPGGRTVMAANGATGPFCQGLAVALLDGKYGFLGLRGEVKISPRFLHAWEFSGGLAPVQDPTSGKWGYIDTLGDYSIKPQFDSAFPFHEGLAGAALNGLWGFINRRAEWKVNPVYFAVRNFDSGLALVLIKRPEAPLTETKSAYMDTTGKLIWESK